VGDGTPFYALLWCLSLSPFLSLYRSSVMK